MNVHTNYLHYNKTPSKVTEEDEIATKKKKTGTRWRPFRSISVLRFSTCSTLQYISVPILYCHNTHTIHQYDLVPGYFQTRLSEAVLIVIHSAQIEPLIRCTWVAWVATRPKHERTLLFCNRFEMVKTFCWKTWMRVYRWRQRTYQFSHNV